MAMRYGVGTSGNGFVGETFLSLGNPTTLASSAPRARIYTVIFGAIDALEHAWNVQLNRFTGSGGTGTTLVPEPFDLADPASRMVPKTSLTVEPTYSADEVMLSVSLHVTTTFAWRVPPEGGIIIPHGSTGGVGLRTMILTAPSKLLAHATFHYEE